MPEEGQNIHGLFMEGGRWNRQEGRLDESEPKKLFCALPLVMVTAVTKGLKRSMAGDYGPYGAYEAPVYKYPARTDRYIIFHVTLATREKRPVHWNLRGAALLCSTE